MRSACLVFAPAWASTVGHSLAAAASSNSSSKQARCQFASEPPTPGFYWDAECKMGMKGCLGDGKSIACRFCGAGAFADIPCPPTSCHFQNEPFVPYYWDNACEMGQLGCWADGIHSQCRFCGDHPYTNITCPAQVGGQNLLPGNLSRSEGELEARCTFHNEPAVPYFWDAGCRGDGGLGCLADGVHPECRFCSQRPFESVACPNEVAPPASRCSFPEGAEPDELYYWDPSCELGMLGCWADGMHSQCRFCGGAAAYSNVSCPAVRFTGAQAAEAAPEIANAGARVINTAAEGARDIKASDPIQREAIDVSQAGQMPRTLLSFGTVTFAVVSALRRL